MSNFEQSTSVNPENFPIGFPQSCVECPSLVMAQMLRTWREGVGVRNQVMDHNANNPDNPALTPEILTAVLLSSTSEDDFMAKMHNSNMLMGMSSEVIIQIDKQINRIEDGIDEHTKLCDTRKAGPVKVRLPRKVGGLTIVFCSAELNNPEIASCGCSAPDCMHNNRISGTIIDQK